MPPSLAAFLSGLAAIGAWIAENAVIHAAGYSGFGGRALIAAVLVPFAVAIWVWEKCELLDQATANPVRPRDIGVIAMRGDDVADTEPAPLSPRAPVKDIGVLAMSDPPPVRRPARPAN